MNNDVAQVLHLRNFLVVEYCFIDSFGYILRLSFQLLNFLNAPFSKM